MAKCNSWTMLLLAISGVIRVNNACSEHALQQVLFENYKKEIRPVKKQSTQTVVAVDVQLQSIISLNGQEESIELILWTAITWQDEFLQWNPIDFDNCSSFYTLASNVWIPDYVITNQLDSKLVVTSDLLYVHVYSNGLVYLWTSSYLTLRCPLNIQRFPFDTQTCKIKGTIWAYNSDQILLTLAKNKTDIRNVQTGTAEFEAVAYYGEQNRHFDELTNAIYSELHYYLTLRRRPEYYIFVLLLPSFLLTSLCIIGIFTPNSSTGDRNEKTTLGLMTLLSMSVILNIVADQMPKSSTGLPLLGYYVLCEIGMCTLAIILSTAITFVHERATTQEWRSPAFIRWIATLKIPCEYIKRAKVMKTVKNYCSSNRNQNLAKTSQQETIKPTDPELAVSQLIRIDDHGVIAYIQQIVSKIDDHLSSLKNNAENRKMWTVALDRIDFLLAILLLVLNVILTFQLLNFSTIILNL